MIAKTECTVHAGGRIRSNTFFFCEKLKIGLFWGTHIEARDFSRCDERTAIHSHCTSHLYANVRGDNVPLNRRPVFIILVACNENVWRPITIIDLSLKNLATWEINESAIVYDVYGRFGDIRNLVHLVSL
jgi:hypothetical protein